MIILSVGIVSTVHMHAQEASISMDTSNKTIAEVLENIENQTDFQFFYNSKLIDMKRRVAVKIDARDIFTALNQLFAGTDIQYKIAGKDIILTSFSAPLNAISTTQGNRKITGTVVDENGEPIIGANVLLKGTSGVGTITDSEGKFNLQVSEQSILKISYIGYLPKEIAVEDQLVLHIILTEDTKLLDEVVVVGYGTVRKVDLAGSVSVIDNKSFKNQAITSVSDALQGRMSGVLVESSGVPGGSVKIRVRGANSINKSNDPLYVVDGIVRESGLEGLNTDDIQSIQILKDASSTAIYGSRGSNGVVLITTKSGRVNQRIISFDAELSTSSVYKKYDLMNPYEYANAYMDVKKNPGAFKPEELEHYKNGGGIDWQEQMLQTAITQSYKVSLSNGNKDAQYYISGNYMNREGIFVYNNQKRYNVHINVTSDIAEWLHVTADVNASHNTRHGGGNFGSGKGNTIWQLVSYSPSMSMYNEDGTYAYDNYNSIGRNPYGIAKEQGADHMSDIVNGMIDLRFNIVKGLTFNTTNGIDYRDSKIYSFSTKRVETDNSMRNSDHYRQLLQTSNNLTYSGKWGKHALTATGVFEMTQSESRDMSISGRSLLTESVGYWNVGIASTRSETNGYSKWSLMSGVGRVLYNFSDRYLLTATLRADGSSKFTKNKWGYFPSLALAWNLSNEKIMESQQYVQDAKLRMSYGVVGSQALDAYGTLGMLSSSNYGYGGSTNYPGYWSHEQATPDLTWEKTKQFDAGVDFSFFEHRLKVSIDYYQKKTVDALLQKTIPNYDGGGSYWINAGEIQNYDFEFSVEAWPLQGGDLTWSTTLTGTYNKNEVVDLAGDKYISGVSPAFGLIGNDGVTRAQVGYAIGTFYLYDWKGIDKITGNNIYADTNQDGKIDSNDRIMYGKPTPDWTFGWNNQFAYKDWEFNLFFTASIGAKRLNLVRFASASCVGDSRFVTLRDAYHNNWDKNPENPSYASLSSTTNSNYPNSTQYLEDASYLRLQNISLSYHLKKSKIKLADVRLSLSCQNLFTLTEYSGYDPAAYAFSFGHADVNSGIDMGGYPTPRTFTLGMKLNF